MEYCLQLCDNIVRNHNVFGSNFFTRFSADSQDQLSSLQRIGVAGTAGFASALVGGPAELVMTIQQRSGWSLSSTLSNLSAIHGYGIFKRAMAVTAVRDMIWSASYLALGPVLSSSLHDRFPSIFGDASTASLHERTMASLGGSVVAGLITVYATQPIDTIKTVMQGQLVDIKQRQQLPGFVATFRELVGRGGVKYLYRGTVARGTRLVGAVFILGQARNVYEDLFTQYALLE